MLSATLGSFSSLFGISILSLWRCFSVFTFSRTQQWKHEFLWLVFLPQLETSLVVQDPWVGQVQWKGVPVYPSRNLPFILLPLLSSLIPSNLIHSHNVIAQEGAHICQQGIAMTNEQGTLKHYVKNIIYNPALLDMILWRENKTTLEGLGN